MKDRFIHARLCRFLAHSQLQVKTGVEALLFLGSHPGQIFKPLELSIRLELHAEVPNCAWEARPSPSSTPPT